MPTLAGSLGRVEPGGYPRAPATPPATRAEPPDRVFSIYYSIYCSRGCWPGVGGGSGAARGGEGAPGGVQSCPRGAGEGLSPLLWGQLAPVAPRAVGSKAAEMGMPETPQPKGDLYWGLQPLNRAWHFLHLPPAPGPRGVPKAQLRYLYLYTCTYTQEQGRVRSRVTRGTESWGRGARSEHQGQKWSGGER